MRIPSWATAATLAQDGGAPAPVANGTFALRRVTGASVLVLELHPEVRAVPRADSGGALSIYRGALLYALPLQEQWVPVKDWGTAARWTITCSMAGRCHGTRRCACGGPGTAAPLPSRGAASRPRSRGARRAPPR